MGHHLRRRLDQREQKPITQRSEMYRFPSAPELLPPGIQYQIPDSVNGRHSYALASDGLVANNRTLFMHFQKAALHEFSEIFPDSLPQSSCTGDQSR